MHPVFQVIVPALILLGIAGGRVIMVQVLDGTQRGRVLTSQIRVFITDVERLELFGAGHRALAPGQRLRFRPRELLERTRRWTRDIDALEGDAKARLDELGYATTGLQEALARASESSWMNTNCTNSSEELDQAIRFFGELTLRINGFERALDVKALPAYRDPTDAHRAVV